MFPTTLEGVASVMDPAKLRWIGFSHFESDECGALNEWLRVAPRAEAVCSFVGAWVMVNDFADRPPRTLANNEVFATGRHRLQFIATPHVPHGWDAGLFFEPDRRILFCSDLFFQPGDPEALTETSILGRTREAILQNLSSPLANDMAYTAQTESTLKRIALLRPQMLATMHGSSFRGDGEKEILGLATALKEILGAGIVSA